MSNKILKVIPEKCISCGACVSICPKSFTLDMDDYDAVSIAINPPVENDDEIMMAVEACPTDAIEYK